MHEQARPPSANRATDKKQRCTKKYPENEIIDRSDKYSRNSSRQQKNRLHVSKIIANLK